MNVWAVTYEFNGQYRVLLVENSEVSRDRVLERLHPAIQSKDPEIEFVGTLA
jgi:hypothetical protein